MCKLEKIVKEMLSKYTGGEEYFNNLDKAVQDEEIVKELMELASNPETDGMIITGKFGEYLVKFIYKYYYIDFPLYFVSGGLRKQGKEVSFEPWEQVIKGKKFDLLDDSFYSGKTRNKIKKAIKEVGGELINTYVIYDGSKEKDNTVHSLFRYYDRRII